MSPNPLVFAPNLWLPNPGEGGGFENDILPNPGDGGGLDDESLPKFKEGGTLGNEVWLKPGDGGGLAKEGKDEPVRGKPGDSGCEKFGKDPKPPFAKPGDRGGSANEPNPGDGGGLDFGGGGGARRVGGSGVVNESKDAKPDEGCDGTGTVSRLNRPNLAGSLSSSFSLHEKLDGADEGPGEMGSPRFGVELPRTLVGLRSSGLLAPFDLPSSGNGAVKGWLGEILIASTDRVIRCLFVGLLPALILRPALGASFLFESSFWKS
jgi:hypothetical protein